MDNIMMMLVSWWTVLGETPLAFSVYYTPCNLCVKKAYIFRLMGKADSSARFQKCQIACNKLFK